MLQGLWSAVSSLEAQASRLDALADDVANVNTPGFKSVDVELQPAASIAVGPALGGGDLTRGSGVVDLFAVRDWSEGPLTPTGHSLDLGIDGPGFFRVQLASGDPGLVRAGQLTVDGSGRLVDASGHRVLGVDGNPITVPPGEVSVATDGTITVRQLGGSSQSVGQLSLALPARPDGLIGGPGGVWLTGPTAGTVQVGAPGSPGLGLVRQGVIERSNTDLAATTVALLVAQQAYTFGARVVDSVSQMWSKANQLQG